MNSRQPRQPQNFDRGEEAYAMPEAEIEAWAERERQRRRAWLEGPTDEEKRAWAQRERRRRLREQDRDMNDGHYETDLEEGRRKAESLHYDAALALVGAANRLAEAPYQVLGSVIRAGREWETEQYTPRPGRRRVRLDDDY